MSKEDIKQGDTVELKLGSPAMTVEWVGDIGVGELMAHCTWFDDLKHNQARSFSPNILTKVSEVSL